MIIRFPDHCCKSLCQRLTYLKVFARFRHGSSKGKAPKLSYEAELTIHQMNVLEGFRLYRELHPTATKVPYTFSIPKRSLDYPERLWGLNLGLTMYNIINKGTYRKYHEKLVELGFSLTKTHSEERIRNILEALRCYRQLYPFASKIPQQFVVPTGSVDFPQHLWGLKLGKALSAMINRADYSDYHDEVRELGFSLTKSQVESRIDNILEALRCYRALHPQATRVPQLYQVPEGSVDFPQHLWGLKLGKALSAMINRADYSDYHDEVRELGFSMKTHVESRIDNILEALRCYRALHPQATRVPQLYQVPEGSADFPQHLWGLKLGKALSAMINRDKYAYFLKDKVLELGFIEQSTKQRLSKSATIANVGDLANG